ncbi:hypothetical protein [Bdellovibrio reynosensis]|uniref:Uncharacterized protein n=1 Tax=Bdellovibrio reynosensis TaxID=2835041 RepID=A0ABY4CDK0_9BACT|nr:hypothetical protein [Bdellovibrio reynosensis]UOF02869.1 hypothetical protein MNR06_07870 [Bdellovibrio reynosensis]
MSYQFYKVLHMLGFMLLFFGFGGLMVAAFSKVTLTKSARLMAFITHGLGLFLIFLSGFGMAARLGLVQGLPAWVQAKIGIWLVLGIAISLVKRKGYIGWPIAILLWGLGTTAAFIAINKPF